MTTLDKNSPYYNALMLQGIDEQFSWLPPDDRDRARAYVKYDQLYWNDQAQYFLRVMADEKPVYVPNPRTIVDTTSHYYLKGLSVGPKKAGEGSPLSKALTEFLKREMFYSRFHQTKHQGVARGDYAFHMTADMSKPEGRRISLTPIHPSKVILDTDPDDITRVIRVHLVELAPHPDVEKAKKGEKAVKELVYWYKGENEDLPDSGLKLDDIARGFEGDKGQRTVYRKETLWATDKPWWNPGEREELAVLLEEEPLPDPIDTIPVYWFNNQSWDSKPYGYSELRGFEPIFQNTSQGMTDQGTALSLLGLGLYATDGGKPTDPTTGQDVDWEVYPGYVAEVPAGAYFRKVEGITSVAPNIEHVDYLESKLREAGGLSDVALGRVDVQTASSAIALAIKFMPTLAKLDERDKAGVDRLGQLFFDWKKWWQAYEGETFTDEIVVTIGDKLPTDRTARINELNNMLDRGIISKQYYRDEMQNLGYSFPPDLVAQIDAEKKKEAEQAAAMAPPGLQDNAQGAADGSKAPPPNPNQPGQVTEKKVVPNQSNNRKRPNESSGTEANQDVAKQARGGKPTAQKASK
jgi:hypothetical protein